jgi:choline dehydrogenase-like flavoprotein
VAEHYDVIIIGTGAGAALYRLRPPDFGEIQHVDGVPPAWPVGFDDFEPWYAKAEQLYQVHGTRGEDPTERPASQAYVVDTSFFPSIGAVNPAPTAIANALRVGEHLTERLA